MPSSFRRKRARGSPTAVRREDFLIDRAPAHHQAWTRRRRHGDETLTLPAKTCPRGVAQGCHQELGGREGARYKASRVDKRVKARDSTPWTPVSCEDASTAPPSQRCADWAKKPARVRAPGPPVRRLRPRCGVLFSVCPPCDRGQIYCPPCQAAARVAVVRAARKRHQQSAEGRAGSPRSSACVSQAAGSPREGSGCRRVGLVRQGSPRRPCARLHPGA